MKRILFMLLLACAPAVAQVATPPPATAFGVQLTWDAPTNSPDPVAGYDIYEAASGVSTWTLTGTVTSSMLGYTDQASYVQQGATLDYIVESVDAQGNESVPSNEATISIPSLQGGGFTAVTT